MRRCSTAVHHSLSELNITPLLDLAFVLLVIFIITTTPVVNDLALDLPAASHHPKDAPRKANYVTLDAAGRLHLNQQPITPEELLPRLIELRMANPDLSVIVRGDARTRYRSVLGIMDALQQAGIVRVELATEEAAAQRR